MKAKYILEALEAMKEASGLGYTMDTAEFARIIIRLKWAEQDLRRAMGEIEIPIEKEAA